MTSIYNIGCFVGAMSTILTGDWLGRPRQILLGSTIVSGAYDACCDALSRASSACKAAELAVPHPLEKYAYANPGF